MEQINQSEETINVKEIIFKYTKYWYYFFLSIVLCLFGAFLYNRYSTPIYSGSTTILIRDDSNASLGAENLLEGLELFSGKKNLKNEIEKEHKVEELKAKMQKPIHNHIAARLYLIYIVAFIILAGVMYLSEYPNLKNLLDTLN